MSKGGELLGWLVGCAAVIVLLGLPTFILWNEPTVIKQDVQTPTQQPAISPTPSPLPSAPGPTPSPIQSPPPLPTQASATPIPSASPKTRPKRPRRGPCDYYDEDDNYLYTGPC
jgi:hypothetical protein